MTDFLNKSIALHSFRYINDLIVAVRTENRGDCTDTDKKGIAMQLAETVAFTAAIDYTYRKYSSNGR